MPNNDDGFVFEPGESKTVWECPWYRIDLTEYTINGVHAERFLMVQPDAVNVLVHDVQRDLYLIEREFRIGAGRVKVNVPSGGVADGETPYDAALRETQEETGVVIQPGDLRFLFDVYKSEGAQTSKAYLYRADLHEVVQQETDMDETEVIHNEWVTFDELYELFQNGDLSDASSAILVVYEKSRRMDEVSSSDNPDS